MTEICIMLLCLILIHFNFRKILRLNDTSIYNRKSISTEKSREILNLNNFIALKFLANEMKMFLFFKKKNINNNIITSLDRAIVIIFHIY